MNTLLHGCHNTDTDTRKVIRPYIEPDEDCDHPLRTTDPACSGCVKREDDDGGPHERTCAINGVFRVGRTFGACGHHGVGNRCFLDDECIHKQEPNVGEKGQA